MPAVRYPVELPPIESENKGSMSPLFRQSIRSPPISSKVVTESLLKEGNEGGLFKLQVLKTEMSAGMEHFPAPFMGGEGGYS